MVPDIIFCLGQSAKQAGMRLTVYDAIGSTNTAALQAARHGDSGAHWFVTSDQIAGKGRRNRAWVMPRGNLAASVLNVMDIAPATAATLGFVAGLSVVHALDALAPAERGRIALKWPNDCLADGLKFVGIDLHAEQAAGGQLAIVVGIGINVIAAPQGMPTPATSLAERGFDLTAAQVFAALSDAWTENIALWNEGRGFAIFRKAWLNRAARLGETVSILNGTRALVGIFETIDEDGCLMLRETNGVIHKVTAGDVFFGDARSAGAESCPARTN